MRIKLNNIKLFGYHGIYDKEIDDGQEFMISVSVKIDKKKLLHDRISDTLDYSILVTKIKTIVITDQTKIEDYFSEVYASVTCSGTASLEIAKRMIPQLIIYKFNFLTSVIVKYFVKVKYANLINIFSNI